MSLELLIVILFASLAFLLLIGQWIALALGSAGLLVLYMSRGELGLQVVSSVAWNNSASYILIAVPMFLLMGELILRSGVSTYFYRGIVVMLGWLPGGLLHANIVSCAIFSAVSGSSVATAATVGTVAIPELKRHRYEPKMIYGSLAAGGTLGILIPPSIIMVLYGALVEESVAKLFIAGIIPGLAMSALFMVYVAVQLMVNPRLAPPPPEHVADRAESRRAVLHVVPVFGLLLVVLGGIYTGVATPTEAAALGAAGAMALAASYGNLTLAVLNESVISTVKTTCMVIFIIIGAQILSTALTYSGVSRSISEGVLGLGLTKWQFFMVIVVLYVVLGFFVDGISMIYMTLPVLLPLINAFEFDLIWFGIVLTILIELGQITPPVGLNLFTIHAISGGASFADVAKGSLPYVFLMLIMIALLAIFPELALWLPATMRGG